MDTAINFLEGTPWWVYVLFIYLVSIGIKGTQPRGITLKQMLFLPVLLTVWSLYALILRMNGRYEFLVLWAAACSIGIYVGLQWVKKLKLAVDKVKGVIYLRGSWVTLILILFIFFTRYTFGALYAMKPQMILDPTVFGIDTCITGIIIGFFIGRAITMWIRYHNSIE